MVVLRLLALVGVLSLAVASEAIAAPALPKGSYGCSIGASEQYAGQLYILDGSHYRLNKSKIGVYTVSGTKLAFPSGVFKGLFRGRYYMNTSHRMQIALTSLASGFETEYCERGT